MGKLFLKKGGYRDSDSVNLEYLNADKISPNNAGLDLMMGFLETKLDLPVLTNVPMHGEKKASSVEKVMLNPNKKISQQGPEVQEFVSERLKDEIIAGGKTRARGKERPSSTSTSASMVGAEGVDASEGGARERTVTANIGGKPRIAIPTPRAGAGAKAGLGVRAGAGVWAGTGTGTGAGAEASSEERNDGRGSESSPEGDKEDADNERKPTTLSAASRSKSKTSSSVKSAAGAGMSSTRKSPSSMRAKNKNKEKERERESQGEETRRRK